VWISTTRGLSRLNPETGEIRNFNTSHGLQGDDFNGNASIKLSDGTLLFGGNNGFNAFDPSKIAFNDYQGQTLITAFSKMNQPQTGRFLSDGSETIELSYKENVFSFEFALMDFTAPEDNTFEYQLVGFDEDWINSGKRNNVSYTNLDAGDYEFRVRGYNNDGVATDKIASIHLSVAPPPWRTWYAYLAYALIALALFMTAFRLYTSRVIRITNEKRNAEERQRLEALVAERTAELNKKVEEQAITLQQKEVANKEIHHRVKNNLQVILGLLTLQAETEENEHFQTAMNEIRQRITSMSLIHKSLYEQTVATIDIKQYAENLINSIRQFHPEVANGNIVVALEVDNETLDIDTALPVGLVLNELITNCLKHGFANLQTGNDLNLIKVTFQRDGDNYVMTVSDNGAGLPHGFDIDSPSSMGSELILIFAQQLDGQISAANLTTGGAIFTLSFPVPETKLL
jgi:two-component sensor histidine kinase